MRVNELRAKYSGLNCTSNPTQEVVKSHLYGMGATKSHIDLS